MAKIKKFKYYLQKQITIDEYLYMYYNFQKGSFSNLTHKDVKHNFPYIKRKKNEDVTRENILKGEVLLVKDKDGIVLAYQNPFAFEDCENKDQNSDIEKTLEKLSERLKMHEENCKGNDKVEVIVTVEDDIDALQELTEEDLKKMNCYKLAKTKKQLEEQNARKLSRLVQKELYFRKKTEHGTKKGKIRMLEKEERND